MSSAPLTPEQLSRFSPMDFLTPAYRQQLQASPGEPVDLQRFLLDRGEVALH